MDIGDWRSKLFFQKKLLSTMYVAFRHVARQIWLRWPSDQPLVSPYNAGVLSIKPVMRITAIINWKILWPANLILMSREKKDSEERINSLKTVLKLVKDRKSVKIMCIFLYKARRQSALKFCLSWANLGLLVHVYSYSVGGIDLPIFKQVRMNRNFSWTTGQHLFQALL